MLPERRFSPGWATAALLLTAALAASCQEASEPTAPALAAVPQSGDPTVVSVEPDSSKRGIRLDITVRGSGFDLGSGVTLERQGVPAFGVTTDSTDFVNHKTLVATITIAADADTGRFDVAVLTSKGRKGIGIELFAVEYQLAELGMFGGTWSAALAISDQGEVVGSSCTNECLGRAFYWTETGGMENLGTLPGFARSGAHAITERGEVFGRAECWPGDPECSEFGQRQLVRWDRIDGTWQITPLQGCSGSMVELPASFTDRFVVNDRGQCIGSKWQSTYRQLYVQTLSGGTVASEESLPLPVREGWAQAWAISNHSMVVGAAQGTRSWMEPMFWYRDGTGAWTALTLPFPERDLIARATTMSGPDAAGRMRIAGYTERQHEVRPRVYARPILWTLEVDPSGSWHVVSLELLRDDVRGGTGARSYALTMNDAGDIVGVAGEMPHAGAPVKWPAGGGVEVLPVPRGGTQAVPIDINNRGWIIGSVWDQANGCTRAAIWWQP